MRSKSREYSIFTQGCLVQIFTTRGVVAPPANNLIMLGTSIRSFRHLEHQNPSIFWGDIGRARSVQQFRRNGTEEWSTVDTMRVLINIGLFGICVSVTFLYLEVLINLWLCFFQNVLYWKLSVVCASVQYTFFMSVFDSFYSLYFR